MIIADASGLSLLGAAIYLCVALACLVALRVGHRRSAPTREWRIWALAACAFAVLAAMRMLAAEDHLRAMLRASLDLADARAARRAIQLPLALAAFVIALMATVPLVRRIAVVGWASPRAARDWVALAMIGMAGLVGVRVISLHATDALLFSPMIGPLRLNWLLDLGFAGITMLAALRYAWPLRVGGTD